LAKDTLAPSAAPLAGPAAQRAEKGDADIEVPQHMQWGAAVSRMLLLH